MMVAQATGLHRIILQEAEATALADATANVASFYNVPSIAPETIAWVNLIQTLAMVYGTRIIAARAERAANAKTQRPATQPQPQPSTQPAPNPPKPTPQTVDFQGLEIQVPTLGS